EHSRDQAQVDGGLPQTTAVGLAAQVCNGGEESQDHATDREGEEATQESREGNGVRNDVHARRSEDGREAGCGEADEAHKAHEAAQEGQARRDASRIATTIASSASADS